MKFTDEELYEIAVDEAKKMGVLPDYGTASWMDWKVGVGQWAYYSARQDYKDEEAVRAELRQELRSLTD